MRVIVQKYGGSSVSTVEKIRAVAAKVVQAKRQGYEVVVVVSAMGDTTDNLLELARQASSRLSTRDLDMLLATGETISATLLSLAIQSLDAEAISLSASQCGIITDDVHSNARILEIRSERIRKELARGAIVVVPGFQGVTQQQEITTLGRGGSDTTAVALAAALDAESCEIYTDVNGVYSADPRVVPEAVKLEELNAGVMQELAWHGAQVMKAEAINFASAKGIPIVVRATFADDLGTLISPDAEISNASGRGQCEVAGVSGRKDLARITLRGAVPMRSQADELFEVISRYDLIFGSIGGPEEPSDLFISNLEMHDPESLARDLAPCFDGTLEMSGELGAVSLVGPGLGSKSSAFLDALKVLEDNNVPLIKSFNSRESLTFIIPQSGVDESVKLLHQVFIEGRQPASQPIAPV